MKHNGLHTTLDSVLSLSTWFRKMCQSCERNDLANASGIPKSDAVPTKEAHDQSWTIPGRIMGNQKFGSKGRLPITDRGKPIYQITSVWPKSRQHSETI
jgi:hypothetical protein